MNCPNCAQKAARISHNTKSDPGQPLVQTVYYRCSCCETRFELDKSVANIRTPDDPDKVYRRVLSDLTKLTKPQLQGLLPNLKTLIQTAPEPPVQLRF